jgi:U3 small nucleolar RNA-associated protein 13
LFSGGDDGTVRVWDLVKKACNAVLDKHFSAVTSIALSTDGWSLLSAGRDKVLWLTIYLLTHLGGCSNAI